MVGLRWLRRFRRSFGRRAPTVGQFVGDYRTWSEASRDADGYDAALILERVCQSARVARAHPEYLERDGVLVRAPQWNFPLLACMLRVAADCTGSLSVLDVGGSLGSVYFQCRPFLEGLSHLSWSVVEQRHFATRGRCEFEDGVLRFFDDVPSALAQRRPNLGLLSSVLSYLPDPYGMIAELADAEVPWLIVDRTPILSGDTDRIVVQHVPAWVYGQPVRYPARLFAHRRLRRAIEKHWPILLETEAMDRPMRSGPDLVAFRLIFAGPHISASKTS